MQGGAGPLFTGAAHQIDTSTNLRNGRLPIVGPAAYLSDLHGEDPKSDLFVALAIEPGPHLPPNRLHLLMREWIPARLWRSGTTTMGMGHPFSQGSP
jgi:hypothetical protein